jgi:hypothetical protein
MTKLILSTATALVFGLAMQTSISSAQCTSCGGGVVDGGVTISDGGSCGGGTCGGRKFGRGLGGGSQVDTSTRDEDGMVQPTTQRHLKPGQVIRFAAHDHFSPEPIYAYSNAGIAAGYTHAWNKSQATATPWHGNWSHWRWGTPTALVVPANSSYQTNYAWGVAQTTSTPLYHQFGRGNAGVAYGPGFGMYPSHPYYPSSTNQFGIYSVRAPW